MIPALGIHRQHRGHLTIGSMNARLSTSLWSVVHRRVKQQQIFCEAPQPQGMWVCVFVRQGELKLIDTQKGGTLVTRLANRQATLLYVPGQMDWQIEAIPACGAGSDFACAFLHTTYLQQFCSRQDTGVKVRLERANTFALPSHCPVDFTSDTSFYYDALTRDLTDDFYNRHAVQATLTHIILGVIPLLHTADCSRLCQLKEWHYEKIIHAEQIIRQNLHEPCSLIALSRMVALNDCTLKRGFKEVYGTTVFDYLNNLRMENALEMIRSGKSVGEIAQALGYKNHSSFTAMFKKKFGCTPRAMRLCDNVSS